MSRLSSYQRELFDIAKKTPDRILLNEDDLWLEFAREFLRIKNADEDIVPFIPKKFQIRFLQMYWDSKKSEKNFQVCVNKSRQIGSSTLMSMIYTVEACLRPNIEILIGANLKDGAGENIWDKFVFAIRNMPNNVGKKDREIFAVGGQPGSGKMVLKNSKSKIHLIGEKVEVGRTLSCVLLSEAAHYHDFDEVMKHLSPALRSGKKKSIIIESTAKQFGDSNHGYYKLAEAAKGGCFCTLIITVIRITQLFGC